MDRMKAPFRVANTLALFMIAYALLVSPSSAAPLGPGFEYQGRIGNLTGSYDFRFRLFNAATGGAQVYATTATATDVPVSNGEYRTVLRFGDGVVPYLSGEALYVDVEYRVATTNANAPYTEQPGDRAQLMPQAYAMSLRPGATTKGNLTTPIFTARNNGSGTGIHGQSSKGVGVVGESTSWIGVYGVSSTQSGVTGKSTSFTGVWGESTSGAGVYGRSSSWLGVHGESTTQTGVLGKSTTATGVWGESRDWLGVFGLSTKQTGVAGKSTNGAGVTGESRDHYGVYGTSTKSDGVQGVTGATNFSGVAGIHTANGFGVYGRSTNMAGVYGTASNGHGVEGVVNNQYMAGVRATNTAGGNALSVSGNAAQSPASGGLIKAMALIDPQDGADPVKQCFNSQLPGTQTTSGNCGITVTSFGGCDADRAVDFGFDIASRIITITPFNNGKGSIGADIDRIVGSTVRLSTFYITEEMGYENFAQNTCAKFFIVVY